MRRSVRKKPIFVTVLAAVSLATLLHLVLRTPELDRLARIDIYNDSEVPIQLTPVAGFGAPESYAGIETLIYAWPSIPGFGQGLRVVPPKSSIAVMYRVDDARLSKLLIAHEGDPPRVLTLMPQLSVDVRFRPPFDRVTLPDPNTLPRADAALEALHVPRKAYSVWAGLLAGVLALLMGLWPQRKPTPST